MSGPAPARAVAWIAAAVLGLGAATFALRGGIDADTQGAIAFVLGLGLVAGCALFGIRHSRSVMGGMDNRGIRLAGGFRAIASRTARRCDLNDIIEETSANARANLGQIRYEQGADFLESRRYVDAEARLREAVDLMPDSAEAHNNLGVALASMGRVAEAMQHFQRAVQLAPGFAEARRNLESAQRRSPSRTTS